MCFNFKTLLYPCSQAIPLKCRKISRGFSHAQNNRVNCEMVKLNPLHYAEKNPRSALCRLPVPGGARRSSGSSSNDAVNTNIIHNIHIVVQFNGEKMSRECIFHLLFMKIHHVGAAAAAAAWATAPDIVATPQYFRVQKPQFRHCFESGKCGKENGAGRKETINEWKYVFITSGVTGAMEVEKQREGFGGGGKQFYLHDQFDNALKREPRSHGMLQWKYVNILWFHRIDVNFFFCFFFLLS